MASDIAIVWNNDIMEGDISFKDGDMVRENGLSTAVLMSMFTDRRDNNERGWWGDQVSIEQDQIGSRLWTLERASTTIETIVLAKEFIEESLQWILDDGVVAAIVVTVERQGNKTNGDRLAVQIEVEKTDGNLEAFRFADLWEGQFMEIIV